jgi:diguanylate cyclase
LIQKKLEQKSEELNNLKKEFEKARKDAPRDFLTGTGNRKAFDEFIVQSTCDAASQQTDLCLLLVDIDGFKKFNDEHGNIIGDEVIRFVAHKIVENVRGRDFVARYAGEEFAVVLPNTTLNGAKAVAENIRSYFDQAKLKTAASSRSLEPLSK